MQYADRDCDTAPYWDTWNTLCTCFPLPQDYCGAHTDPQAPAWYVGQCEVMCVILWYS